MRRVARNALIVLILFAPVIAAAQDVAGSTVPWGRYATEVTRLYRLGGGQPVWYHGGEASPAARAAIAALLRAGEHGLAPTDYSAMTLDSMVRRVFVNPEPSIDRDRFDALLSVSLIRYLDDLRFGRLHPASLDRSGADTAIDLAVAIRRAIEGNSIPELVEASGPQLAQYRNLRVLLNRYRRLASDSSLPPIALRTPVHPGDPYAEAATLRRRLATLGDLPSSRGNELSNRYTAGDGRGVRAYQVRHGLRGSGILDSTTVAELNLPFSWRVRQIELALERLRWLPPIGRRPFVVVNVPAFELFAFDSSGGTGSPVLGMRVIVGSALDTRTPVLFERMKYIEFRPYWTVPLSITVKEILPLVEQDPGYLRRNDMEILAHGGRVLDSAPTPEIVERLRQGALQLRQRPGRGNPLGLVKFVFPNAASVYLHGTPRADLFAQTRRDFSHGCIRVEDPTALAAWILRDQPRWTRQAVLQAQLGSSTVRAPLSRAMPVIVWYTTAVAAPDGKARFYADIYNHDRTLDQALRALGITSPPQQLTSQPN